MIKTHKDLLAKYSTDRDPNIEQTEAQKTVHDILDSLRPLPPVIDETFYMRVKNAATALGIVDDDSEEVCAPQPIVPVVSKPFVPKLVRKTIDFVAKIKKFATFYPGIEALINKPPVEKGEKLTVEISPIAALFGIDLQETTTTAEASSAAEKAGSRDAYIAANLRAMAQAEAASHRIYSVPNISQDDANTILSKLKIGVGILSDVVSKTTRDKKLEDEIAHLISSDLAFNSSNGSFNGAAIANLSANEEFIKRQKAKELAAVNDFKSKRPTIMFISEFIFENKVKGQILGWRKVTGAAGYIVHRVNIFTGREVNYTIFNEELESKMALISEYVENNIIPFYEIPNSDICAFLDEKMENDAFFSYNLTAFQTFTEAKLSSFITPSFASLDFENSRKNLILEAMSNSGVGIYSELAKLYFGDESFDWILAAVNVRNSISRRDNRSVTRKYAYLDASPDFIFQQISSGKFVVPSNISDILSSIFKSLSSQGVIFVLREILRETGILYTFEGLDPSEDGLLNYPAASKSQGEFLKVVASSIDGETFILNLKTLVINLTKFIKGSNSSEKDTNSSSTATDLLSSVKEIEFGDANRNITLSRQIGNLDAVVDLHTVDGIGKLIRTIRIISDLER